jgi:DNA replicative helicase MCM subunit Mcm2 (Cdc46/Mcm family)
MAGINTVRREHLSEPIQVLADLLMKKFDLPETVALEFAAEYQREIAGEVLYFANPKKNPATAKDLMQSYPPGLTNKEIQKRLRSDGIWYTVRNIQRLRNSSKN